ncbi:MAG: two pore domain potassium channel family protein [Sulfuricella sp.]|nr:two pore domain potassium channel family protein [Sulfuricella sp.]
MAFTIVPYWLILLGLTSKVLPKTEWVLCVYIIALLCLYASMVHVVAVYLEPQQRGGEMGALALFFITSVLLVGGFGIAWDVFKNFAAANSNALPSEIDAFYFSVVAFTTLGFGDFVPINNAGKILVSIEALMGATHMVAFFSIVVGRVKSKMC